MLVSLNDAVEIYGKNEQSIYSNACIFRKAHGEYPKWYVIKNKAVYIDLDLINQQSEIDRKVWQYNTDSDSGLYWVMAYELQMSDAEICKILASNSKHFNSITAWASYISNTMFAIPSVNKVSLKITMGIEFLRVITRYLYDMIKNKDERLMGLLR